MRSTRSLVNALTGGIFGLAVLLMASSSAHAQYDDRHSAWHNQNDHQRREHEIYGRSHWLKHHQRQERHDLRDRLYNRHGYYDGYNNGGYYNRYPSYGNYGYYNPRYYGSYGYSTYRYSVPHYHSGNAFRRGLHHLLGGH